MERVELMEESVVVAILISFLYTSVAGNIQLDSNCTQAIWRSM